MIRNRNARRVKRAFAKAHRTEFRPPAAPSHVIVAPGWGGSIPERQWRIAQAKKQTSIAAMRRAAGVTS